MTKIELAAFGLLVAGCFIQVAALDQEANAPVLADLGDRVTALERDHLSLERGVRHLEGVPERLAVLESRTETIQKTVDEIRWFTLSAIVGMLAYLAKHVLQWVVNGRARPRAH